MRRHGAKLTDLIAGFWRNRELIFQLTRREVIGRYRGSALGIFWSFVHPFLMLAIYTLVFGVIFKARWHVGQDSKAEFALVLFAGLLVYNIFSECAGKAPTLVVSNAGYVKKVVFPLEILAWVSVASALFHAAVSFSVWLLFYFVLLGTPPATALIFPIVLVDVVLLTLGVTWFLASLGVYVRDMVPLVAIATSALMFLTPIFYPLSAIPEDLRHYFYLNPFTFVVDQTRDLLIWGVLPSPQSMLALLALSVAVAWLGFAWFQKTRRGFADVL
jgi:lipopolysaccharide transport system permease protein